jgi:hypothetical protein
VRVFVRVCVRAPSHDSLHPEFTADVDLSLHGCEGSAAARLDLGGLLRLQRQQGLTERGAESTAKNEKKTKRDKVSRFDPSLFLSLSPRCVVC